MGRAGKVAAVAFGRAAWRLEELLGLWVEGWAAVAAGGWAAAAAGWVAAVAGWALLDGPLPNTPLSSSFLTRTKTSAILAILASKCSWSSLRAFFSSSSDLKHSPKHFSLLWKFFRSCWRAFFSSSSSFKHSLKSFSLLWKFFRSCLDAFFSSSSSFSSELTFAIQ